MKTGELHSLFPTIFIFWVAISRTLRCSGYVARIAEARSASKVLTGKPTGRITVERLRR